VHSGAAVPWRVVHDSGPDFPLVDVRPVGGALFEMRFDVMALPSDDSPLVRKRLGNVQGCGRVGSAAVISGMRERG
jgi:hypothetical protein